MECLLDFFVLSVNSEYGQRGIAGQLIEHHLLLEEAKKRGCQGIITDASNHKSQKVGRPIILLHLIKYKCICVG
jgi:hypothetical protein